MATNDISKDLEERRAARRAAARRAAAPKVAEIQAEQERQAARPEADRLRDRVEAALVGVRFTRVRDYVVVQPVEVDGRWSYRVSFTQNGIDWIVGEVKFYTGPRGGRSMRLYSIADPTAPWLPLYADAE